MYINRHTSYGQFFFPKASKQFNRKRKIFSKNSAGKTGYYMHGKKNKSGSTVTHTIDKKYLKMDKDKQKLELSSF